MVLLKQDTNVIKTVSLLYHCDVSWFIWIITHVVIAADTPIHCSLSLTFFSTVYFPSRFLKDEMIQLLFLSLIWNFLSLSHLKKFEVALSLSFGSVEVTLHTSSCSCVNWRCYRALLIGVLRIVTVWVLHVYHIIKFKHCVTMVLYVIKNCN